MHVQFSDSDTWSSCNWIWTTKSQSHESIAWRKCSDQCWLWYTLHVQQCLLSFSSKHGFLLSLWIQWTRFGHDFGYSNEKIIQNKIADNGLEEKNDSSRGYKQTMFVPPKSPADELWDGPRTGVDGAKELFAADEVPIWLASLLIALTHFGW